jgi:hypothetical protein
MSIKFCSECGTKLEYKYNPPKFCSNCGAPTSVAASINSEARKEPTRNRKIQALNDDETDAEFVPQINKLDIEIEDYTQPITLGSLFGQGNSNQRRRNSSKNIKDLLDGRD